MRLWVLGFLILFTVASVLYFLGRIGTTPTSATSTKALASLATSDRIAPDSRPAFDRDREGDVGVDDWKLCRGAIERGLAWLTRDQRDDGSWRCDVGRDFQERYEVEVSVEDQKRLGGGHVGVSAIACLALLASGSTPDRGDHALALKRGIEYVLRCMKDDGFVVEHGTNLYSHAFATKLIAEAYGITKRRDLWEKALLATDVIEKGQSPSGGWRYRSFQQDSDVASTACQVLALRSDERNGIEVRAGTIDRALRFVRKCAVREGKFRGGFKYRDRPIYQTRATFGVTAATLTILQDSNGIAGSDVAVALDFLKENYDFMKEIYAEHFYSTFGHYFAVQAMKTAGSPHWDWYWPRIRRDLLASQHEDGSWEDNVGAPLATAMSLLTLLHGLE